MGRCAVASGGCAPDTSSLPGSGATQVTGPQSGVAASPVHQVLPLPGAALDDSHEVRDAGCVACGTALDAGRDRLLVTTARAQAGARGHGEAHLMVRMWLPLMARRKLAECFLSVSRSPYRSPLILHRNVSAGAQGVRLTGRDAAPGKWGPIHALKSVHRAGFGQLPMLRREGPPRVDPGHGRQRELACCFIRLPLPCCD